MMAGKLRDGCFWAEENRCSKLGSQEQGFYLNLMLDSSSLFNKYTCCLRDCQFHFKTETQMGVVDPIQA